MAGGNADRHFRRLLDRQAALENQLARAQGAYARSQDRTYETAQTLAVRTALMLLGALVLLAIWLRRAVGAPADALRSASGRLAGGDLETPVVLGVENELGAVASDLETMRRRLAGRMEALERLRPLSAQVVGATSLQRLAEVVLEGLRPEIGATRAVLGAARPGGDLHLRALAGFPDPAVADDPYGRVTAMNRALEALTCWTEAEATGRPYAEVLPLAADRADGPADLVSRYGRKVPVAVSSAPIFDTRGRVVGGST